MSEEREEVFYYLMTLVVSLCAYAKLMAAQNQYFRILYAGISVANGVMAIVEIVRKKAKSISRGAN